MIRLARLSIAHPVRALAVWGAVAIALALIGIGVSDRLSPSVVVVPGTASAHAQHLADAKFGASVLVPSCSRARRARSIARVRSLVRRLRAERDIRVLSAWDGGSTGKELRPKPGAAMIVAAVARTEKDMVKGRQAEVEGIVDRAVAAPVRAHVTGQPAIDVAHEGRGARRHPPGRAPVAPQFSSASCSWFCAPRSRLSCSRRSAQRPRSPSFGAMALLGQRHRRRPDCRGARVDDRARARRRISAPRLRRCAISRRGVADADATAVDTTGRAVLIGGTALTASLALAPLIAPTEILTSLGIGVAALLDAQLSARPSS